MTMTPKQTTALALRDRALAVLHQHGVWKLISGVECKEFDGDGFSIVFYIRPAGALPSGALYSLEAWLDNGDVFRGHKVMGDKVLNLVWNKASENNVRIVSFRRGPWEERLLSISNVQ
jgi:hypothetical protein